MTFVAYMIFLHTMEIRVYRGSGVASRASDLPFGLGKEFKDLGFKGDIHYTYKAGRRGVSCVFESKASFELVRSFCERQGDWELTPAYFKYTGNHREYIGEGDGFVEKDFPQSFRGSHQDPPHRSEVKYSAQDETVIFSIRRTWGRAKRPPWYVPLWWQ